MNSPYFRLHFYQAMNDLSCFLRNQPKQNINIYFLLPIMALQVLLFGAFELCFMYCIIINIATCTFIVIWKAIWSNRMYIVVHCNKRYFNG